MAAVGEQYTRVADNVVFDVIRVRSGHAWMSAGPDIPGEIIPVGDLDDSAAWQLVGG